MIRILKKCGYTDIGCDIESDNEQGQAREALVLIVVAVNDNFMLPIFFMNCQV